MARFIRQLLQRRSPELPVDRRTRQRLDQMSLSQVAAYSEWLARHDRTPCIASLEDYQDERRRALGLVPPKAIDRAGARMAA